MSYLHKQLTKKVKWDQKMKFSNDVILMLKSKSIFDEFFFFFFFVIMCVYLERFTYFSLCIWIGSCKVCFKGCRDHASTLLGRKDFMPLHALTFQLQYSCFKPSLSSWLPPIDFGLVACYPLTISITHLGGDIFFLEIGSCTLSTRAPCL